jgi:hypothetical protein
MHGASREDLPRAPQILSAAVIRVLPDGFLLKAIVVTVCEHEYPPPPTIASSYDPHVRLDFVAFPVCLKDNPRSCPKQNSSDQNGIIQF